ncbi:hypothetical protein GCM10010528_11620 [Gordonia defluvii]|jgi:hypothetical protein|uniref:Bacteriocin biosynthesis cyclodehydratase domain-containing protein n=2 Tax=Gordoniaceae TaxID=85026 RepID=A0ABP6L9C5_9ACTN
MGGHTLAAMTEPARPTPSTARTTARPRYRATVLVRGDHQLQVGCDPERSLLVELPPTVGAQAVAELLDALDARDGATHLRTRLREIGLDHADFMAITRLLHTVETVPAPSPQTLRVCLHGTGPLRDGLDAALTRAGYPLVHSSARRARPWRAPRHPTLVVLTDFAHHDPLVVGDLMRHRVPHLPVVLRDGVGVVGPLVLPGQTSCLRCADHHRATLDPQWPLMCAQLVNRPGFAGEAVSALTVGVAVDQIDQVSAGLRQCASDGSAAPTRPDLVDRTVEIHPCPVRLRHKHWPAHPHCHCGACWGAPAPREVDYPCGHE